MPIPPAHTVVFAAFDSEEQGHQGAKAFVGSPPVALATIALNVNFDMVSRNDRREIYAAGTFQNPSLRPLVTEVQQRTPVAIRFGHDRPDARGNTKDDWTLQSEHGVFHQAGIPFIYFGVEDHRDYHKPTDTADRIDPAFFGDVVEMLVDFVIHCGSAAPVEANREVGLLQGRRDSDRRPHASRRVASRSEQRLRLRQGEMDGHRHHDRHRRAVEESRREFPLLDGVERGLIEQRDGSQDSGLCDATLLIDRDFHDHDALDASALLRPPGRPG
jgi:hypothetical protein